MPADIVQKYLDRHYRIVVWPHIGDSKGPREPDWPKKQYTLADYSEGYRVGILTGTEVSPGHYLHDVDIDWAAGSLIAQKLLPATNFVFGRASKKISHCFYTLPEALPSFRYEDIDKTCLIELRGTKLNGEIGLQTMVPPSIWTKDTARESLEFLKFEEASFIEAVSQLKQRVCLSAIGMILTKHLGKNGFGHDARLAWSGFLLRAGITVEEMVIMGEAISVLTNNTEIADVRRTVESTSARLTTDTGQKIKGGPALSKMLGKDGRAVINRINEWLGRDSDFIRDKNGQIIKDHQENIARAITNFEIELSIDRFSERRLYKEGDKAPAIIDDSLYDRLWLRIDKELHFRPSYVFFEKVMNNIGADNPFHPVNDYLNSLKWDGIQRIDHWLHTYGDANDDVYVQTVGALVLIAAVRRIRQPGCKFDEMLVLESGQGQSKSTALRTLCPKDDWFSDDLPLNVDAKQIIERTLGKWLIEASDLTGGRKADRDHLKSMLSRQIDGPARLAYAHNPVERARQFIIIGTTNSNNYLGDPTGGRRFWPVIVKPFKISKLVVDRDQLWAEAVTREQAGDSIRLPEKLWVVAGTEQEARREEDAWEDTINEYIPLLKVHATGRVQVTTAKLWDVLNIEVKNRDRLASMRISEIMQRLGFVRTKIYDDGKTQSGYVGEKKNLDFGEKL